MYGTLRPRNTYIFKTQGAKILILQSKKILIEIFE